MSVRVINGDCRAVLPTLDADSFDCIVTSPPYWGLRDYGVDGQIGLEPTLDAYVETMAALGDELWRVLKPEGTFWLNLGDSYSMNTKGSSGKGEKQVSNAGTILADRRWAIQRGLKPKDLCGVPWRVAFALQSPRYRGRIKRIEDRIWLAAMIDAEGCMFIHKRKAGNVHATYTKADGTVSIYDRTNDTFGAGLEVANTSQAIVERCMAIAGIGSICSQSPDQNNRRKQTIYRWNVRSNECRWIIEEVYPHLVGKQQQARVLIGCPSNGPKAEAAHAALIDLHNGKESDVDFAPPRSLYGPGWYLRSAIVWQKPNPMPESVTDRPTSAYEMLFLLTKADRYYYDADAIAEPLDRPEEADRVTPARFGGANKFTEAQKQSRLHSGNEYRGTPTGTRNARNVWSIASQAFKGSHFATMPAKLAERCIKAGCPRGGHVLDPFSGAGTTGLAADRLGRNATLIELNLAYRDMGADRIRDDAGLFAKVQ